MRTILLIALSIVFYTNTNAQAGTGVTTPTLLPDQNPNYQKSRDKYMQESATLTKNEGQTVQQTYKAIDDVQAKKERKELASERRHERRMARIQSRGNRRNNPRFFNNNPYYNDYYYYNYDPYGFRSPQYYSNNIYGNTNSVLNTALLGLTVWSILRR